MNKLIIGISPRFSHDYNSDYHYVRINIDYLNQVIHRDAIPFILYDGPNIDAALQMCDGFIIIGGDDINPKFYNENNKMGK